MLLHIVECLKYKMQEASQYSRSIVLAPNKQSQMKYQTCAQHMHNTA